MSEPTESLPETNELLDENEQLRASLENTLEENAVLTEDRDRLLKRVGDLSRELQVTHSAFTRHRDEAEANAGAVIRRSQTDEELRVAFEELQVLTEELEVANTSLHQTNQ